MDTIFFCYVGECLNGWRKGKEKKRQMINSKYDTLWNYYGWGIKEHDGFNGVKM